MVWQYFFISERKLTTTGETATECTASSRRSTILVAIIGLGQSSAIATYRSKANRRRRSQDENGSIRMNMYSLGVTDLDFSISPDVFGLRAFDKTKPVTTMLPSSSPCEQRLMVPDDKLGKDGFHDVIIENLSGTPSWRSSYVSPAEVTSLRRQWPKAVFETLRRRAPDIERLRRDAPNRTDKAFRYSREAWGIDAGIKNQRDPVFPPLDSNQGRLARRPPTGRIGGRRRRPSVS